jgi:PPOX class probable F420-dependent enzyme
VQPVTFALVGDRLYSAVDHKPKRVAPDRLARVRRLRRDPRAALTVDHYDVDWSRLAWVQVLGEVEILTADASPDAVGALCSKYPAYTEAPPAGPMLALRPERALYWSASSRSD